MTRSSGAKIAAALAVCAAVASFSFLPGARRRVPAPVSVDAPSAVAAPSAARLEPPPPRAVSSPAPPAPAPAAALAAATFGTDDELSAVATQRPGALSALSAAPAVDERARKVSTVRHEWLAGDVEDAPSGDEIVFATIFDVPGRPRVQGLSVEAVVDGRPSRVAYRPSRSVPNALKLIVRLPGRGVRHTVVLKPVYDLRSVGGSGLVTEVQTGTNGADGLISWTFASPIDAVRLKEGQDGAAPPLKLGESR